MKKIFTLLATLMLTVSVGFAQQNYCFWKDGKVTRFSASEVDSLTFDIGSWLFQFSDAETTNVTSNSFQVSAKVALNEKVKSVDAGIEVGICYSEENSEPEERDRVKILGRSLQNYSSSFNNMVPGTTYYYRFFVYFLGHYYYSEVGSVTTMGEKPEKPQTVEINGHNFIDLGLPSGLLWAESNIGAPVDRRRGDYFAWGETETKTKDEFTHGNYKWGSSSNYNDNNTSLAPEDDAATVNWGAPCRMPSGSEFEELLSECHCSWIGSYQGFVPGYLITATNGNSIFLPTTINRRTGIYWTRYLNYCYDDIPEYATVLYFTIDGISSNSADFCHSGNCVRPVAEK